MVGMSNAKQKPPGSPRDVAVGDVRRGARGAGNLVAAVAAVALLASCGSGTSNGTPDSPQAAPTTSGTAHSSSPPPATPASSPTSEPATPKRDDDSSGRQRVRVMRVIDGDTVEVHGLGAGPVPNRVVDVRLLEINTPEKSQCGYDAATRKLDSLLGERARVEQDQELRDQYGRWLLYVWSGDTFINREMVSTGYAEAKLYEPNDHYWDRISAADTSETYTPWPACGQQQSQPQQPPEDDDGKRYRFPAPPPDLDCGGVSASGFQVRPGDPHRFDRDGDGIGCEG